MSDDNAPTGLPNSRIIDLTHTVVDGMPVYPGDPHPRIEQTASIATHGYVEFRLTTGLHVGTHLDAPLHMVPGGSYVSDADIERLIGVGVLIDAREQREIGPELLDSVVIPENGVAVVLTGWSSRFGTASYYHDFPRVTEAFARRLADTKVSLLALDTPSPDDAPFPVHKILLSHGIYIIENLRDVARLLSLGEFEVIALPMKLRAEGAPVRVVCRKHCAT